ncbi:hypothetical protein PHLGIDRAFT_279747 [Phlebiopsis gigantea 11061_1 CR5-6]|uniref:Uncharacterized protein n=1 Tax=Phlebiopsis gigantea (strain 11061_1 CR5-6) TaxID=745531 RepID=A0A0C3NDU6_PHLG1|nr:hypothetical protein PHLGIDRAFT_279747 [Phlebiopsis gigantea 11061_1 CR5-6]
MLSARPPVTYLRRKTRGSSSTHNSQNFLSSPLQELSPGKDDVTLSEMSRRMKKRSRQVASTQEAVEQDTEDRLAKKLRRPSDLDLRSMAQMSPIPTVPSTPVHHDGFTLPLDTQQIYDSLFETPSRPSDDLLIKSYAEPDQLSPLPIGRRMLSRTRSRNLKENVNPACLGLASPFSSRPTSRTSSPRRSSKTPGKRPLHLKSRTLSSSFLSKQVRSINSAQPASSCCPEDSTYDSIFSPTTHAPAPVLSAHSRTGSIPNMPSGLLDQIPTEDWLVPAKALSRSPPSLEDMDLDDIGAEHPSFYLDAPVQISTPPRKRRTTVTLRNFFPSAVQNPLPDAISMDLTAPVAAVGEDRSASSAEGDPGPAHPRRRRRTVVHMSSDSIFSSALDFSAYMTEFSPTRKLNGPPPNLPEAVFGLPHPRPTPASSASTPAPFAQVLDTAFSPAPTTGIAPVFSVPRSPAFTRHASQDVPSKSEVPRPSLTRRANSLQTPSVSDREELNEMFTMLGLSGTYLHAYMHLYFTAFDRRT